MKPVRYKDKKFRYEDDPEVLTYDQLLEKLQQVFEEADFAYGIEALSTDPGWCISELLKSPNIEVVEGDCEDAV